MRLPKQVLIIPYRIINEKVEYCIFKRKDRPMWQWISGGVEDFDKDNISAAKREIYEETGIPVKVNITKLEGYTKIPVVNIVKEFKWGEDIFYAEEYSFAVNINDEKIELSEEHSEYKWTSYEDAISLLRYDSNKNSLWELNEKIKRHLIR